MDSALPLTKKAAEGLEQKSIQALSPEEKQKVDEISSSIDIEDTQAVLQFGVSAQSSISSFSDTVLEQVRSKDTGYVGDILSDLMFKVKDLDVDGLSTKDPGFFGKIFGGLKRKVEKFVSDYEKLSTHIDRIIDELEKARMLLLKDITLLDNMFEKNLEYLKELDFFILAGEAKVEEMTSTVLPQLKAEAEKSDDPADAQKFNDLAQLVNRFEKKVHDLKLSRMIAIQAIPQIRLIQNNDQVLVEKIQSSILNTIPLWKNQIVIAITLFRQKKALEAQKKVSETTNDLLAKNSEMLKANSIGVAQEAEKGIVEIETLKKVNSDLITTVEETLKIQAEGKQKRAQAEVELGNMEKELKNKLLQIKSEGGQV